MMIILSTDAENFINAAVQSGRFATADEMINRLIEEEARREQSRAQSPQDAPEILALRLQAWVDTHLSRHITIDDSRDMIYGGQGE